MSIFVGKMRIIRTWFFTLAVVLSYILLSKSAVGVVVIRLKKIRVFTSSLKKNVLLFVKIWIGGAPIYITFIFFKSPVGSLNIDFKAVAIYTF